MAEFFINSSNTKIFRKNKKLDCVEISPFNKNKGREIQIQDDLFLTGYRRIKPRKANEILNKLWKEEISNNGENWRWNYEGHVFTPITNKKLDELENKYDHISDYNKSDGSFEYTPVFYRGSIYMASWIWTSDRYVMLPISYFDKSDEEKQKIYCSYVSKNSIFPIIRDDKKIITT